MRMMRAICRLLVGAPVKTGINHNCLLCSEAYFLKVRVPTPHNILHFLQKRENKVGTVCKTHFPLITSSVIS